MFKYEIGQLIYYLKDNKVHSAEVLSRIKVENSKTDAHTEVQINFYKRFGESRIQYSTCHGEFDECEVFNNKDDLLKSL